MWLPEVFDTECDLGWSGNAVFHLLPSFGWDEQEQESSPTGPQELAPDGPGLTSPLVHLIDLRVAHLWAKLALLLPRLVEQLAEGGERPPPVSSECPRSTS